MKNTNGKDSALPQHPVSSRMVRRVFRTVRKGSYFLSNVSADRYLELKRSSSRHLTSYSGLSSARHAYAQLSSEQRLHRAVLNTSRRFTNLSFVLPRSRKGSFVTGRRLNSAKFFVSLSKKMELGSPQNHLRSAIRSLLRKDTPLYSSRYFVSLPSWQRLVREELSSRSDTRHTNKLRRLRSSKKPTFFQTHLSPSAHFNAGMSKSPSAPLDFSWAWWGRPDFSISISRGFVMRYLEDTYVGIKDSLSRLVDSWSVDHRKAVYRSKGFIRSYGIEPQLAHVMYAPWLSSWSAVMNLYSSFTLFPKTDLYYKIHSARRKVIEHILRFRFNKSRLHVILEDSKEHNTHFFTTPGLFIRYFQGKKSLKKNKALKYLMARFIRKMLLVLNLESVGLVTKGVPVNLDKLLTAIFKPLSHPFTNPLTGEVINESDSTLPRKKEKGNIGISSVTFFAPKPFSYQKTRKRGRIKRKIQRRLVRMNKVID